MNMNRVLIILIAAIVLIPAFSLVATSTAPGVPDINRGLKIFSFSDFSKELFYDVFYPFNLVWKYVKTFWNNYIMPWFGGIWDEIKEFFKVRKQIFKQEFPNELKEMKDSIIRLPETFKNLWEKINQWL